MATQEKNYLKGRFETGDRPSQLDFFDLLDSTYNDIGITSLPTQSASGSYGKILISNGASASWDDLPELPSGLPDQTDNQGKILTTDGETASWNELNSLTPEQELEYILYSGKEYIDFNSEEESSYDLGNSDIENSDISSIQKNIGSNKFGGTRTVIVSGENITNNICNLDDGLRQNILTINNKANKIGDSTINFNVKTPTNSSHAANKEYTDNAVINSVSQIDAKDIEIFDRIRAINSLTGEYIPKILDSVTYINQQVHTVDTWYPQYNADGTEREPSTGSYTNFIDISYRNSNGNFIANTINDKVYIEVPNSKIINDESSTLLHVVPIIYNNMATYLLIYRSSNNIFIERITSLLNNPTLSTILYKSFSSLGYEETIIIKKTWSGHILLKSGFSSMNSREITNQLTYNYDIILSNLGFEIDENLIDWDQFQYNAQNIFGPSYIITSNSTDKRKLYRYLSPTIKILMHDTQTGEGLLNQVYFNSILQSITSLTTVQYIPKLNAMLLNGSYGYILIDCNTHIVVDTYPNPQATVLLTPNGAVAINTSTNSIIFIEQGYNNEPMYKNLATYGFSKTYTVPTGSMRGCTLSYNAHTGKLIGAKQMDNIYKVLVSNGSILK